MSEQRRPSPLSDLDLAAYWRVALERRRIVLAGLVAGLAMAILSLVLSSPVYRGTTTLQIERFAPEIIGFDQVAGVDPSWKAYRDFHKTQHSIIRSRTVLSMAAERIDLLNHPGHALRVKTPVERLTEWFRSALPRGDGAQPDAVEPRNPLDEAAAIIEDGLRVRPQHESQLVELSFEHRSPALARDVANAVAAAYQQYNFEKRHTTTDEANTFLTKEVARVQAEINRLERDLRAYGRERGVVELGTRRDITESALAGLNARLVEARARLASARARHEAVRQAPPDSLPEVLGNPVIINLETEYGELERKHSEMAQRFMPGWPALARTEQEMREARARLDAEVEEHARRVIARAETSYREAESEVAHLKAEVAAQTGEVQRVGKDAVEYATLEAEIQTRRRVLSELVARQSETETSRHLRGTNASNIVVVDRARIPQSPVRPRKALTLLLGLPLGLSLGLGLALLQHHIDNSIKTEEDVAACCGDITVLGHIPLVRPVRLVVSDGKRRRAPVAPANKSAREWTPEFGEAFKILRTSVSLACAEHPPRHIVVTSSGPAEGKSTVACNLAMAMAELGRRVLLLDADLRRASLHLAMGVVNNAGLSSCLSGNASPDDVIQPTKIPGLAIITSGPLPPNPSELLGAPGLRKLLDHLVADRFDLVVIDTPPVLSVAEAVLVAGKVDGTILVARSARTTREGLGRGLARLRQSRANVLGVVLNAEAETLGKYYDRYGYYASGSRENSGRSRRERLRRGNTSRADRA